ncbi:Shikimate kinase [Streptomyces violaceorubidus]
MSAPLIVLVGPMGVGKSTVGRFLAERLGTAYRDTDEDIVTAEGRTIAEIFVDEGEAAFRALEKEAVRRALGEHDGRPRPRRRRGPGRRHPCAARRAAGRLPLDGRRGGGQAAPA